MNLSLDNNSTDHTSNFKYIFDSTEKYLKSTCQEEKLTDCAKLYDSFDIDQLIEGNE